MICVVFVGSNDSSLWSDRVQSAPGPLECAEMNSALVPKRNARMGMEISAAVASREMLARVLSNRRSAV